MKKPDAARIRAALAAREMSQADLASELRVSPAMVSQIITGKKRSARLEHALASMLGLRHHRIFPRTQSSPRRTRSTP